MKKEPTMSYVVDPTLLDALTRLEDTISTNERTSIQTRWESGRRIIAFYFPPESKRKALPKGALNEIARQLGVVRSEVGDRMKFFRMYYTEEKLSTVMERFKS